MYYYFTDKIVTGRLVDNSELVLTRVTDRFVENQIINKRLLNKPPDNMYVCIHNPLLKDAIFRKLSYLQTMPLRDSLPMVNKGDIIFVIEAADDLKHYIMVTVQ